MLLEVIISALLVGLIVVATFTGFEGVSDSTASERAHSEASLLAAQSQEQLRSDPVSSLEKLVLQAHVYTTKVDGTTYTVTQEGKELNGSGQNTACTATEQASTAAPNFRITSSVSWGGLRAGKPVSESSIITPPTGSSIEVDVGNGEPPTAGVAGVTAAVVYTPIESTSTVKLEGTTGPAGCVLFTGIRATSVKVEVREKPNFVTPSGALKVAPAEYTIAPNITTHDPVAYDEGGAIQAAFAYEGKSTAFGKTVTGDTFVVTNTEMGVLPELQLGGNEFAPEEVTGAEKYAVKTGIFAATALTAKGSHFAMGDLFPFPKTKWTAFAGDCAANNPATVTGGTIKPNEGFVNPGATTSIAVPMSYVKIESHQGTETAPSVKPTTEPYEVKILNTSCSAASPAVALPNNAEAVTYAHYQKLNAEGALASPFQPFGKFELCVQASVSPARRDKFSYSNTTAAGPAFKIYPEELTFPEQRTAREKEEAPAREKRETEETNLRNAATSEAATKAADEATELTERNKWQSEKLKGEISEATRTARIATQTTARIARESTETAKRATRSTEETALHTRKTAEETAKTNHEHEEATEASEKATRVSKGAPAVESGTC